MTASLIITRRHALIAGCTAASLTVAGRLAGAAPASASRVDIVKTQGVTSQVVHQLALSQGFFARLAIEPNVLQVADGGKCVAALVSGAAKICISSGFNQVLPAIERGARIKIIAGALNLSSQAMYSAKPEIRKVSDLEGKVIGIGSPGSVLHQMTTLLLKKQGVNVDKVQFRNVGSNGDVLRSVIAKTVDAGLSDVEVIDQQQQLGMHVLPDGMLWKEIPEYANQASYASDAAIKDNRDQLVRVLAAYAMAYRFVSSPNSQAAYVQARQKVTGVADPKLAQTLWKWIQQYQPYAVNLALTDTQINYVQQKNVEFKIQKAVLPMAVTSDMSLARDALKLLG